MNQDVFPTVTFKTHLEGVSLPVAVFHQQQAARPERGEGFARHRDKVFESFWSVRGRGGGVDMVTLVVVLMVGDPVGIHEARHQRRDRLEVADLDGKPFVLGFADIGRIADQQVEGRGAEKRTGEVGADGLEALPDVVAHRVLTGHGERAGGQIDHESLPAGAFGAQGHGDAAAARAQIGEPDVFSAAFQRLLDEVLGFGAGNERGGRDPEVPAVELALSEQIGDAKRELVAGGLVVSQLEDEDQWKQAALDKVWPEMADFVGGKEAINDYLKACGKPAWK